MAVVSEPSTLASPAPVASNRFEGHRVATLSALAGVFLVIALAVTELILRLVGLGDPIIYGTDPVFRYRPKPQQLVHRFGDAVVRINNLGIRANSDWNADPSNKVLFLGNSVTYGGSYVSNDELFAIRAVSPATGWVSGSGGVNAWGVENIYGLIVERRFLPARVYVTVLIENDFYRGLAERQPYFRTSKPGLALIEVMPHVLLRIEAMMQRAPPAFSPSDPRAGAALRARRDTVERAVNRLKALDEFLRSRGFVHLIYLSPRREELDRTAAPDTLVDGTLARARVAVVRLWSRPELAALSHDAVASLYHDGVHLSARGHAAWAAIFRRDLAGIGVGTASVTSDRSSPSDSRRSPPAITGRASSRR